jgi:hypothetical protein
VTKADKPTTRISYSTIREQGRTREIVVTIHPTWLGLRLKGTRKVFQLDISAAYQRAAWAEAERLRAEKKAARKLKGKIRRA